MCFFGDAVLDICKVKENARTIANYCRIKSNNGTKLL